MATLSVARRLLIAAHSAALVSIVLAELTGPLPRRTGAQIDGGLDCTDCHQTFRPANVDTRGRVFVEAIDYTPAVKQNIRVVVEHPDAIRWGFQLTARLASDESRQAGTFAPNGAIRVLCDSGRDAPCNGGIEFASHRLASTFGGQRNRAEWEIEWTPPLVEAGDVIFHVAGNAANGNGLNTGDRIYTSFLRVDQLACNSTVRPVLRSVNNAGSFERTLSFNSLVSLFGTGFQSPGVVREAGRPEIIDGKFPSQLVCVAVEIDGQMAPLTYVRPDQINAQVPTTVSLGPVSVRVIVNPGRPNELRSDAGQIVVSEYSPSLFTFNGTSAAAVFAGGGTPVAQPAVHPAGRPARGGDLISLFGTGFGATEPVFRAGEIPAIGARLRDQITVTIGGVQLPPEDVSYAGTAPGAISGLYQFNVRVPLGLTAGDVPVEIRIGGMATQHGLTIPVQP
jgi:uncharacterized protein (TIGR03437 family)